jgi:hypothetical protein
MEPPIYYDDQFPHIHLSLEQVDIDEIASIPDWIHYLIQHTAQGFYQIDMDGSHPRLSAIISTLLRTIPKDGRLSYIHIKQIHRTHFLTPHLLNNLIAAVRENINSPNITIQVTYHNRVEYH